MARVILYYPPVSPQTSFPTWEPLQLICLARALRDRFGPSVETLIIDGRLSGADERLAALRSAIGHDALCVGLTALTCYQLADALDAVAAVKSERPDLPVVFGGWHATVFPEETLKEPGVDVVVRGQGEATFAEVVERFLAKRDLAGVRGILWKRDSRIMREDERPLVPPDELAPLLPEDFAPFRQPSYQLGQVLFYMSSVGCPYACKYCCISLTAHRRWMPLSAKRVLDEIDSLHKTFGFQKVIFWDNVFFASQKRVLEICRGIRERDLALRWSAHARINEIAQWDETFLSQIREAGCERVFIGAESGSQEVLERIGKGIRAEDIVPSFRRLRAHDINVAINWMVGLPGERVEDVVKSVECILEGLRVYGHDGERFRVHMYRFIPFPGTALHDELDDGSIAHLPKTAREWAEFVCREVNDGMEPWGEENGPSRFASTTFYLWKAYLEQGASDGPGAPLLRKAARLRLKTGFYRFPVEWWLWRRFGRPRGR